MRIKMTGTEKRVCLFKPEEKTCIITNLIKSNPLLKITFIPTYEYRLMNLTELKTKLKHSKNYQGLIISNQKVLQAIKVCRIGKRIRQPWTNQFDRVMISQPLFDSVKNKFASNCIQADNAHFETTMESILQECITKQIFDKRPFLYPCGGDFINEGLLELLMKNNIKLDILMVYDTVLRKQAQPDFAAYIQDYERTPDVMIFFSPLEVKYAANILLNTDTPYFEREPMQKVLAVGASTLNALHRYGIYEKAQCMLIDPEDLINTLLTW